MKALKTRYTESDSVALEETGRPPLKEGQALVKLKAVALNRRDQWIREGKYPKIIEGAIMGSDGCGEVVEVFSDGDKQWLGKSVVINPNNNWGDNPKIQGSDYHILGMPSDGTFAEYVAVNADRLHEKPSHLSDEEAAALPLAGLTAFRALFTQAKAKRGSRVLISGAGGGVAQFAVQFAVTAGMETYITSGKDSVIGKMEDMGVKKGFNYKDEGWLKEAKNTAKAFDAIVDSAGGQQFADLFKMLAPGGVLAFYGATNGLPAKLDLYTSFFRQTRIQGSTMGNDEEFKNMIAFVSENRLVPVIDSIRPFSKIIGALDDMKQAKHFGKIVLVL